MAKQEQHLIDARFSEKEVSALIRLCRAQADQTTNKADRIWWARLADKLQEGMFG